LYANTLGKDGKLLGQAGGKAAVKDLMNLLKIAEIGYANKIAETSQFVARRAGLAGISGITGAFLATGGGMSPLTGVGIALLAKHQAKILSSPDALKYMVTTVDDTIDMKIRRANYSKLARFIFDDPDNEKIKGLNLDDPEEVMQYIFTNEFTGSSQPEAAGPSIEDQTTDPAPAPAAVDNQQMSSNMSNELVTKPKNKFVASNVSSPFRPVGGGTTFSPAKRAALASGDLYQAIATAKKGGSINKQGIMYFAGRRRP